MTSLTRTDKMLVFLNIEKSKKMYLKYIYPTLNRSLENSAVRKTKKSKVKAYTCIPVYLLEFLQHLFRPTLFQGNYSLHRFLREILPRKTYYPGK